MSLTKNFLRLLSGFVDTPQLIKSRLVCKVWANAFGPIIFQKILLKHVKLHPTILCRLTELEDKVDYIQLSTNLERLRNLDCLLFPLSVEILTHPLQLLLLLSNKKLILDELKAYMRISYICDSLGRSLDYYAALSGNEEIFKIIAQHKCKSSHAYIEKHFLLHYAVIGGNLNIVKQLLKEKEGSLNFDMDERDSQGRNLLLTAAACNHSDLVTYLLKFSNRLQITCMSTLGEKNALQYAAYHGNKEIFMLLYQTGKFDLTHVDSFRRNVLHYAYIGKNKEIIDTLTPFQKLNTKDQHGFVPKEYPLSKSIHQLMIERRKLNLQQGKKYILQTYSDENASEKKPVV